VKPICTKEGEQEQGLVLTLAAAWQKAFQSSFLKSESRATSWRTRREMKRDGLGTFVELGGLDGCFVRYDLERVAFVHSWHAGLEHVVCKQLHFSLKIDFIPLNLLDYVPRCQRKKAPDMQIYSSRIWPECGLKLARHGAPAMLIGRKGRSISGELV